jgi:hypothetical protein
MTPSRTIQGWENQRVQLSPIHDVGFNPLDYRITEIRLKRGYSRYNLPSWQHFDRVVSLGNNTVIAINGKLQTILKVEIL